MIFTAANPTSMYIILARNGTPPKITLTKLKFNNPKSPQFNAPINTSMNDSLSIFLSLYIITPPDYYNYSICINYIKNIIF